MMLRMMVTAPASGTGKTAVTCGLLALMNRRGKNPCAFKCGPDYIDPMFHRSVLGIESHNLDLFLAGENRVREIFARYGRGHEAVICEGVMGYYAGLGGSSAIASPWHLSRVLDMPCLLVLRPKGSALTLAAVIQGIARFREDARIAGVILNECSKGFFETYGPMLEEESGVPVLGYLPSMVEAVFESRHLGLMTAEEIGDLKERIERIASVMEKSVDVERLEQIFSAPAEEAMDFTGGITGESTSAGTDTPSSAAAGKPRIAVARDEAFSFIYEESLDALRDAGAELLFFSPLRDRNLPEEANGLYLPGGYPELYGEQLENNRTMRGSIREAVGGGMPTIAECGGFLYLGQWLKGSDSRSWEMAGALEGEAASAESLVRFGYGKIAAKEESMLFRPGEEIPVHEFHYWDTTEPGEDLTLIKATGGDTWSFGYATDSLYAGFPHIYLAGEQELARRFVEAAGRYGQARGSREAAE